MSVVHCTRSTKYVRYLVLYITADFATGACFRFTIRFCGKFRFWGCDRPVIT
jgi:hypothetical protein